MSKKSKNPPRLIVRDYIFALEDEVNVEKIKKKFTVDHFNEKGCAPCEYKPDRPCDVCQACPNFAGTYKFFSREKIDGHKYIGVTKGKADLIKKLLPAASKLQVKDMRVDNPMRTPPEFILELRDKQILATDDMMQYRNGLLIAPPRSGKTVMSLAMICEKKQRTLVIAHQDDLLDQFYFTIYGKAPDFPKSTNAAKVDKKRAKKGMGPVAIIAKKDSDFFGDADIVMTTYQRFISKKGKKLLRKVAKHYGMVVVDECFPEGTLVWLGDNKYVPIQDLVNSDKIKEIPTFNLLTKQIEMKSITNRFVRPISKEHLVKITMDDGSTQICTEDHLWWSKTRNDWVKAKDLSDQDELQENP